VDRAGDKPWSLLVDCNVYGRGQEDAALLARLGTLAQEVDAAVVGGMDWAAFSASFASPEDERAWAALRHSAVATSIAVASPSLLQRLPYGKGTYPTERFAFTEQLSPPVPGRYLWGSSAMAVAQLLAQSFAAAGGWDFAPGDESSLGDLPTHVTRQDGESVQTPCAQAWLPESKIDALIKEGLVPVVSVQGRGEVRIPRFQSIASPPAALAGPWRNG
jgi:type VI secretion system protein ImpC